MHFYGWKQGLKTGQYYLRSRPSRDAIKFTVNIEALLKATDSGNNEEILTCLNKTEQAIKEGSKKKVDAEVKKDEEEEEEEEVNFECINCSG